MPINYGFDALKEKNKVIEAKRQRNGRSLFRFYTKEDGEVRTVRFLTTQPLVISEHTVREGARWQRYTCSETPDCPFCAEGDRASIKGVWLIYDGTPFVSTDKDGNEVEHKGSVKLLVLGTNDSLVVAECSTDNGLINRNYKIKQLGVGKTKRLLFSPLAESVPPTPKQIVGMLPESFQDMTDGTELSLLKMMHTMLYGDEEEKTTEKPPVMTNSTGWEQMCDD